LPLGDGGLEHPWLLAGCQLSWQAEAWSQGRCARTAEAAMHGPTLLLDSCRDADPARSTQRCSAQSASCSKTQPAVEHVSSACAFVVAFRKPGGCSAMSLPGDDASLVVPEVSCLQVFCAPEPWAAAGCAAACRAMRGGCTDTRRRPPLERALPARGR